jgi:hypothetical protein
MDDVDFGKVEECVAFMRRLGIIRLGSIELGPAPAVVAPAESPPTPEELTKGPPEGDDALYWSVPGPLPSETRDAARPPEE